MTRFSILGLILAALSLVVAGAARAEDRLMETPPIGDGGSLRYILTVNGAEAPHYLVILMPGGVGTVNPRLEDGRLVFQGGDNFLIRSRGRFADRDFLAVSTDSTSSPERILAIVDDVGRSYPGLAVYVIGTSRSTYATQALAHKLDGQVAGFVHTSSMFGIGGLDPRELKSRHLIVHHRMDSCKFNSMADAYHSHEAYGTDFIAVEGGISIGDPCGASAHHGYNGIEDEVVGQIKDWIRQGPR